MPNNYLNGSKEKKYYRFPLNLRDSISRNTHICSLNNNGTVLETGISESVITANK